MNWQKCEADHGKEYSYLACLSGEFITLSTFLGFVEIPKANRTCPKIQCYIKEVALFGFYF